MLMGGRLYYLLFIILRLVLCPNWGFRTLLTTALLNQIKAKFSLRMTWELGVTKLKFRIEDGAYELHRKVR